MTIIFKFIISLILFYAVIDTTPYCTSIGTYNLGKSKHWKLMIKFISTPGEMIYESIKKIIGIINFKLSRKLDNIPMAEVITDFFAFCINVITYILISKVYFLIIHVFFDSNYRELSLIIEKVFSGEGASIIDIFKVLYVTIFESNGFVNGLFSFLILFIINLIYFSILFGFLVDKDNAMNIRGSRLIKPLKYNLRAAFVVVLCIFFVSLFIKIDDTSSIRNSVLFLINKFKIVDLILPSMVQVSTVILPVSTARVVSNIYNTHNVFNESRMFNNRK